MSLENVSREEIVAWLHKWHAGADTLTTDAHHMFFTKDATLTYANNHPVVGLNNIIEFFNAVFPLLSSMSHQTRSLAVSKNTLFLRDYIIYIVKGDPEKKEIKVPALGVFEMVENAGERIGRVDLSGKGEGGEAAVVKGLEIYLDASEVFGRIQGVKEGRL
ncbi:uncharacterized protein PAC_08913 [Phialocephala subalpina]|uniref:SnoaL-like domain-containing protein n=1 Tax=Phialocephala subalpina TaxID=576137 RepID=A0A1L7X1W6_9HELO|nr:uncharacterized protein PAC_08913 [Phialocephala subalpina]